MSDANKELTLVVKMRQLAATMHPRADELYDKADKLEAATRGYFAFTPCISLPQFLGAWARARRLWCECTGEALI